MSAIATPRVPLRSRKPHSLRCRPPDWPLASDRRPNETNDTHGHQAGAIQVHVMLRH